MVVKYIAALFLTIIICAETHAQQHSDLYYKIDSLAKHFFKYDTIVHFTTRETKPALMQRENSSQLEKQMTGWPLIIFEGGKTTRPVNIYELDTIQLNEVKNIYPLKRPDAASIYGEDGVNGAILITADQDFTSRFKSFSNQPLSFYKDSARISIGKSVAEKFFLKQLIMRDDYFVNEILGDKKSGEINIIKVEKLIYLRDVRFTINYAVSIYILGQSGPLIYNVLLDTKNMTFYRVKFQGVNF